MHNLLVIFISFLAGAVSQKWSRFPATTGGTLNSFVISVSLPALILLKVPRILDGTDLVFMAWAPVVVMWLMFFLAWGIIELIGQRLGWSRQKIGTMILTTGLANTSFVGLPLLRATAGEGAIPYGILADQPGEFLIVSTLGIFVAAMYSGAQAAAQIILRRIVTFPPFIALLASLVWTPLMLHKSNLLNQALEVFANTLVPLALFAVGYQSKFQWMVFKKRFKPLLIGLSLRLLLIPLFFLALVRIFFVPEGTLPMPWLVAILESAMATQITAGVVANEFHLDSEMANLMVSVSVPLSLITIPIWSHFLT